MLKQRILAVLLVAVPLLIWAKERPNVIFLMADDQTCYTLGCYGNTDVKTPQIDQLAKEGMVFNNHYATTAICMASRATVMTGMFEYKTGTNFDHGDMMTSTWQKSYPMLLRKAGYRTGFAGKLGFVIRETPQSKPLPLPEDDFDAWGGAPGQTSYKTKNNKSMANYADQYPHSTLSYGAFGKDFVESSVDSDQPFCLSISFKAPHKPADPDPKFDEVYKDETFVKPGNFGREHGEHFSEQSRQDRQYERFHSWHYSDNYDKVMARYNQQIYAIDQAVGMIRKALKEIGKDKNTIIIYTSDNGFFCGSHGYGSKVLPYEESARVPMIVFDPRESNSGKQIRTDALTGNCDIAPTILKLAGVKVPSSVDGVNLMKIYKKPESKIHDILPLINVWGHPATHSLSVVTKDMKYIYWGYEADGFQVTEELYNTTNDPLELTEISKSQDPKNQKEIEKLRKSYDRFVELWRTEGVDYNRYKRYATLFDRHISWDEKAPLVKKVSIAKKH